MKEAKRLRAKVSFMVSGLLIAWPLGFLLGAAAYFGLASSAKKNALQFMLFSAVCVFVLSLIAAAISSKAVDTQVRRHQMPADTYRRQSHMGIYLFPDNRIAQILLSALIAAVHTVFFSSGLVVLAGYYKGSVPFISGLIFNGLICGFMVLYAVYFAMASRCASIHSRQRDYRAEEEDREGDRESEAQNKGPELKQRNEAGTFDLTEEEPQEAGEAEMTSEKDILEELESSKKEEEERIRAEKKAAARKSAAAVREQMERKAEEDRQAALEKKIARMKASQKRDEERAAETARRIRESEIYIPGQKKQTEEKKQEEAVTEQVIPEQTIPEQTISDQIIPEKVLPEETAEKVSEEVPQEEPAGQVPVKELNEENTVKAVSGEEPEEDLSEEETVQETGEAEPEEDLSEETTQEGAVTEEASEDEASEEEIPEEEEPDEYASEEESDEYASEDDGEDDLEEVIPAKAPDHRAARRKSAGKKTPEYNIPNFLKNTRKQYREETEAGDEMPVTFPDDELPDYGPDAKTGILPDMRALGIDYEDFDETDSVDDRKGAAAADKPEEE